MTTNLGFNDCKSLKIAKCDKCKMTKRLITFGGMKLCEWCFYKAKLIVRKWIKQPNLREDKQ